MKKWLIVSDTHGDTKSLKKLLKRYPAAQGLIHLGDHAWDVADLDFGGEIKQVRGNTDRKDPTPWHLVFELAGKRVFLTHGHLENVKFGIDRLFYASLEKEADWVMFGHTHIPFDKTMEGVRFFNPGSLSRPRRGPVGTYGVLEISESGADLKILDFE